MPDAFPRGRFVWHELLTPDPDLAARFYPQVTGWKVQASDDPTYRLWMAGKTRSGGLMALPEEAKRMGAPPQWMAYVAVPDAADTVRQAQSLGARVYTPVQDISWGRFATLADPQGAPFSVFQPAPGGEGTTDTPTRGGFSWHELDASDGRAAWAFYQRLFGWEEAESMDMGPQGTYLTFKRAGTKAQIGGIYTRAPATPGKPHWLSYVFVANADAVARQVKAAGGTVVNGPMDVPGGGRIAQCVDPQGAAFAVHSAGATPAKRRPTRKAKPKPKAKAKPAKKATAKKSKKKPARKPARRARARRR